MKHLLATAASWNACSARYRKMDGSSPHGIIIQPNYVWMVKSKRFLPLKIDWDLGPLVSIGSDILEPKRLLRTRGKVNIGFSTRSGRVKRFRAKLARRRR